jgi:hypothetical protein
MGGGKTPPTYIKIKMNDTSRKTLQYITKLIVPRPQAVTEEACNTQTVPIAFNLSSEQTFDLWERFVDLSKSTIAFFDFSTIKLVQLCEFMSERFENKYVFEVNILNTTDAYVFAGEESVQSVDKVSFDRDLAQLRQKYPDSAIAGSYNPLASHATAIFRSEIPAIIQLKIIELNRALFNDSDHKFNFVLENFTSILHCKKELDVCIESMKSDLEYDEADDDEDELDENSDQSDDDEDDLDYDDKTHPTFVEGFLCDLKPVFSGSAVCADLRRAGFKVYFGRPAGTVEEEKAKNYRKLSMTIMKVEETVEGGGFYWVQCPNDSRQVKAIQDIVD